MKRREGKKNSISNWNRKQEDVPINIQQHSNNNYNRRSSNKNSNYYHRILFTIKSLLGTL